MSICKQLVWLGFAVMLAAAPAQAETKTEITEPRVKHRLPVLSSVFPQGATPGTTLRAEILGEYLDRASTVLFSTPHVTGSVIEGRATAMSLEFKVAADAPPGYCQFRVVSPRGASNILLFRIGDQPHITETEPNSRFEEAQTVQLPVTINARLNSDGEFDFFRFEVRAGETWIFDVRSARNGNGLDPALILLDSRRRKLAHVEDVFIWDPFVAYTFAESGTYYAVVQPTHTRLDPNFAYQLDIRRAPHVETVAPLAFAPGATREATIYGAGLAGSSAKLWFDGTGVSGDVIELRGSTALVRLRVDASAVPGPRQVAVVTENGRSNVAQIVVDETPPHRGGDSIQPPVSITGIAQYRKPEHWSFNVSAGETLVFEVRAWRFGSPADSILRILDEKGKQVAVNDDGAFPGVAFNKDSRLVHTFKEAGRYTIEMRNMVAVTGEDYPYQLVATPARPSFDLMLASDQPYVYKGEEGSVKVAAVRKDGYDKAIPLRIEGLPEGVVAEPAEIAAGKTEGEIGLKVVNALPGAFSAIQISSEGAPSPAWRSARVASGGGEGATFARVEGAVLVVAEKPRFSLESRISSVNLVRGGAAEIPLSIVRDKNFDGEIHFRAENLPAGVLLENAIAPAGSDSVTIRVRASADAATGRFPRVALLGFSGDTVSGEEAPRITILVD